MITQSHAGPAADPILYLKGERAALGPFTATLVHQYWRWEQEPEVIMGLGRQTPESLEARTIGYEAQARSMANQARFTIYDLTTTDPRPVGTTVLRIDHHVRTAEFVIVLGKEGRGRGLAREATVLTLDYGFRISDLRMIWLKVLEPNIAGIKTYEHAGFTETGRLPRAGYWYGQDCDEIIMAALPEDIPSIVLTHPNHRQILVT